MALHTSERAIRRSNAAAIRRFLKLALPLGGALVVSIVLCMAMAACGGSADAPPPPETVPTVVSPPIDQSVVAGATATFAVTANGAAPLAYQWASSTDGVAFTAIEGATAATYTTPETTLAQTGTHFHVVVSNVLGSVTSSAALLTVTPAVVAPLIVTQPVDQTVVAGATATFNVTATGTLLSYQWQSSTDGGTTFVALAGGPDTPTLTITDTTVSQSGERLRVLVSNSAGSVASGSALLTVTAASAAPVITLQPVSQSDPVGATAFFTIAATGTPAPTFQWLLNGVALVNGTLASGPCAGAVAANTTTVQVAVSSVTIGCSGAIFSAVASNGVSPDATSNGATLTVTQVAFAPILIQQPISESVNVGFTAAYTSVANGIPTPTVQWQVSTDGGVTWANVNGATSTTYTTPATVIGDNGKLFRAVFTNASGSATSSGASLTVTTMPVGLSEPTGVAVDAAGNIYIADFVSEVIVKVTPSGVATFFAGLYATPGSADGNGSAARFDNPYQLDIDSAGNLYVSDLTNDMIRKISPAGDVTTLAGAPHAAAYADGPGSVARFNTPYGLRVDAAGNVYVADAGNQSIRVISPAGIVSTLAGVGGGIGLINGTGSAVRFNRPTGVALDAAGNVYVADELNQVIRVIAPGGATSTLAGTPQVPGRVDGTGSAAQFYYPLASVADAAGNLYVVDVDDTIRKVTPAGVVTTIAGTSNVGGNADGPGATATFRSPQGIAIDSAGNLYIADRDNRSIRKITPAGIVSTVVQ